jgi:hypothetical protein
MAAGTTGAEGAVLGWTAATFLPGTGFLATFFFLGAATVAIVSLTGDTTLGVRFSAPDFLAVLFFLGAAAAAAFLVMRTGLAAFALALAGFFRGLALGLGLAALPDSLVAFFNPVPDRFAAFSLAFLAFFSARLAAFSAFLFARLDSFAALLAAFFAFFSAISFALVFLAMSPPIKSLKRDRHVRRVRQLENPCSAKDITLIRAYGNKAADIQIPGPIGTMPCNGHGTMEDRVLAPIDAQAPDPPPIVK